MYRFSRNLNFIILEILQNMWKVLNSIYWKHGCPDTLRSRVDQMQRYILGQHL